MRYRILGIILICMLGACVTNNGNIGPLYGLWRLTAIEQDGIDITQDADSIYFRFQNDIVCITEVLEHDNFMNTFGTWDMADYKISLDFTHRNDLNGEHDRLFNPPEQVHIPGRTVTIMHIDTLTNRQLQMHYRDDKGVTYSYYLEKVI